MLREKWRKPNSTFAHACDSFPFRGVVGRAAAVLALLILGESHWFFQVPLV
jgi:hypothetical protein